MKTSSLLLHSFLAMAALLPAWPLVSSSFAGTTQRVHQTAPVSLDRLKIEGNKILSQDNGTEQWTAVVKRLPFAVPDGAPVLGWKNPGRSGKSTFLIGAQGRLYRSADAGRTWMTVLQTGTQEQPCTFSSANAAYDMKMLYYTSAQTGRGWRSLNGGVNWMRAERFGQTNNTSSGQGSTEKENRQKIQSEKDQRNTPQTLPLEVIWDDPILLSDTEADSYEPKVAVSGEDIIHVTWENSFSNINLSYCRSVNGGHTFSPEREVFPGDTTGFAPQIMTNNNKVYIFFGNGQSDPIPYTDLHMLVSTDYGATWSTRARIGPEHIGETRGGGSISGDTIAFLYSPWYVIDATRRLLVSTDNGRHWVKRDQPFNEIARISITGNGFHMITEGGQWVHSPAIEAMYLRSTDLGAGWQDSTLLSVNDGWFSDVPAIHATEILPGGDEVWSVWRDVKRGWGYGYIGADLFGRFALPGNAWQPEQPLTDEPRGSEPCLADNGSIRALSCLLDYVNQWHVGVTWTNNGLTQFTPMEDITPDAYVGSPPSIAVSHHAIHVVWEQGDDPVFPDKFHIYYRRGVIQSIDTVQMHVLTPSINYDSMKVYQAGIQSLRVRNDNTHNQLNVGSALIDNPNASISPPDMILLPGQEGEFIVHYQPQVAGLDSGHVYLFYNGAVSPEIIPVQSSVQWQQRTVVYPSAGRWQIVSAPLKTWNKVSFSELHWYDGSRYYRVDSVLPMKGYWAKPADGPFTYQGISFDDFYGTSCDTLSVQEGWNLIGFPRLNPIDVGELSTVPGNNFDSDCYGFQGGYVRADTLKPGFGYFVKMKHKGVLVFPQQSR